MLLSIVVPRIVRARGSLRGLGLAIFVAWLPVLAAANVAIIVPLTQIRAEWERIPDQIDVVFTHGPPYGHGDLTLPWRIRADASIGFDAELYDHANVIDAQ